MTEVHVSEAEQAAGRVIRWTELYTAGLPADIRSERLDEVRSDLHEQLASDAGGGQSDRALARAIRARSIRGTLADVSWRRAEVRQLPGRGASIAARVALAVVIAVAAVASTALYVGSNTDSSNSSLDEVQVGYLKDQVHGEALFVVPLLTSVQYDIKQLAGDPYYRLVLASDKEGAVTEYNNYRALLSQLASEQRTAARSLADSDQRSAEAAWLTGFTAAAFALFMFVLWFEPRLPRRSDATRGPAAKS